MNEEQIKEAFMTGTDCSQVVLESFSDMLDLDKDTAHRIAAAFGGGMQHGETCGAVSGAAMVLGLKYGNDKPLLLSKLEEFRDTLSKKYDSCVCKEILKYDISVDEEKDKIMEENLLFTICPKLVLDSIEILETLM